MGEELKPVAHIPRGSDSAAIISIVELVLGGQRGPDAQAKFTREAKSVTGFMEVVAIARNYVDLTGLDHIENMPGVAGRGKPQGSLRPVVQAAEAFGWEYKIISVGTNALNRLEASLNQLGAEGWEVVGFVQSDRTLGVNKLQVILKRPRL